MVKTTVAVDEKKVEAAKRILGTKTLRETVDRAPESVLALEARRKAVLRLRRMRGLSLDKPSVVRDAWR